MQCAPPTLAKAGEAAAELGTQIGEAAAELGTLAKAGEAAAADRRDSQRSWAGSWAELAKPRRICQIAPSALGA